MSLSIPTLELVIFISNDDFSGSDHDPTLALEKPLHERVEKDKLPISMRQRRTGVYGKLVNNVAKEKTGMYRVTVANLC